MERPEIRYAQSGDVSIAYAVVGDGPHQLVGDGMGDATEITRIRPGERVPADPTPGMAREKAIAAATLWSGVVRTDPHTTSGWHHHGEHETSIYVVDGAMRLEFGAGGAESLDAEAGDFIHVPQYVVHRESNPRDGESFAVITRSGTGPVTVNVEGP